MAVAYVFYINSQPRSGLHRKSFWIAPDPKNAKFQRFFTLLKQELTTFTTNIPFITDKRNLTAEQESSLFHLSKKKSIVIK